MTNESRTFFTAVTPPQPKSTSAFTDDLYAQLAALYVLATAVQQQITANRLLLTKADAAEDDINVYAKFEAFQQMLGAMEREIGNVTLAARHLTDASFMVDTRAIAVWTELGEPRP